MKIRSALVRQCDRCGRVTAAELDGSENKATAMASSGQTVRWVTSTECIRLWTGKCGCVCWDWGKWCRCEKPGPHRYPGADGSFCAVCGKALTSPAGSHGAPGSASYRAEDRLSPVSMGIQRRIVGPRHVGPWSEVGTTAAAWKAYKESRRKSPNAERSATPGCAQ